MKQLRKRKKENTRAKILQIAQDMFTSQGFSTTTTAEIAQKADIAEGTIYNYFSSKAEILTTLVQQTFFQYESYSWGPFPNDPKEAAEEICRFLDHYLQIARTTEKSLLREVYSIAFKPSGEGRFVLTELIRFDSDLIDKVRNYLHALETDRLANFEINFSVFIETVYGIVMYQFGKFILVEDISYDNFLIELKEKLKLLISSIWIEKEGIKHDKNQTNKQ